MYVHLSVTTNLKKKTINVSFTKHVAKNDDPKQFGMHHKK